MRREGHEARNGYQSEEEGGDSRRRAWMWKHLAQAVQFPSPPMLLSPCIPSTYFGPGCALIALHKLTHVLTATLLGRNYRYPHFRVSGTGP